MINCRRGKNSDIYFFRKDAGYYVCSRCSLNKCRDKYIHSKGGRDKKGAALFAIDHIDKHKEKGHKVAQSAIDYLNVILGDKQQKKV